MQNSFPAPASAPLSKKIIFTCFLAGLLEIYDFTIFGMLAVELKSNYLSFLDAKQAVIVTYALFAVGFFFRPLGSLIFGYLGDRFGRKTSLVLSVTMMGIASLGFCILPTYQAIGISSCYLLVFFRILQGISVGGEYNGAIIFAIEHSNTKKAGLAGSIVVSGCMSGVLLATFAGHIVKLPHLPEYSWRFAFLFGFILSLVGFFIRRNLKETIVFTGTQLNSAPRPNTPLLAAFKKYWLECITTFFIASTSGVNIYFLSIYLPNYIKDVTSLDTGHLNTLAILIIAVLIPLFGWVSDKLGRAFVLVTGNTLIVLYPIILFYTGIFTNNLIFLGIAVIIYAITLSIYCGSMNSFITEIFPPANRYSCSAFSYSMGMGLIGGTTPMVASLIKEYSANQSLYTSSYILSISLLSLISIIALNLKVSKIK